MSHQRKPLPLREETKQKAKKLNSDYHPWFEDTAYTIFRSERDPAKAHAILDGLVDALLHHQETTNDVSLLTKQWVSHVKHQINLKERIQKQKIYDFDRFTIAGLWQTMAMYLVFLFIKELLLDRYLISFSVDLMGAALALVLVVRGFRTHLQLIKSYQLSMKSLIVMAVGAIIGIVVTLVTLKSPFDITFLIVVIAHFTSKKIVSNELKG